MIKGEKLHKEKVIDILHACFETNKTVNYIIKQDEKKAERIKALIDYSFEACLEAGRIYLTDDLSGVIMCSNSFDKLPFLDEALLTLRFVFEVSGFDGISRNLKREKYVKSYHPEEEEFIYIWFFGVEMSKRKNGLGSSLLNCLIDESNREKLPIYLETSVRENLNFYDKHGFEVYHVAPEEQFGYELYFLRRIPQELQED